MFISFCGTICYVFVLTRIQKGQVHLWLLILPRDHINARQKLTDSRTPCYCISVRFISKYKGDHPYFIGFSCTISNLLLKPSH